MKILVAMLAAILALAFAEPSLGVSDAEAASSFCKYRYNACAARASSEVGGGTASTAAGTVTILARPPSRRLGAWCFRPQDRLRRPGTPKFDA
jgi:hypothetical protein